MTPVRHIGFESHGGAPEGYKEDRRQWKTREDHTWEIYIVLIYLYVTVGREVAATYFLFVIKSYIKRMPVTVSFVSGVLT